MPFPKRNFRWQQKAKFLLKPKPSTWTFRLFHSTFRAHSRVLCDNLGLDFACSLGSKFQWNVHRHTPAPGASETCEESLFLFGSPATEGSCGSNGVPNRRVVVVIKHPNTHTHTQSLSRCGTDCNATPFGFSVRARKFPILIFPAHSLLSDLGPWVWGGSGWRHLLCLPVMDASSGNVHQKFWSKF